MNFWQTIGQFFTEFSIPAAVMILTGLVLIVIEMLRSSRRAFGVCGGILIAAGMTVRLLHNGTAAMLFFMSFGVCVVLFCAHILMLRFQKRGWLYQSLRLSAAAQRSGDQTGEYEFLVGLIGLATTPIAVEGSMQLSDVTFLVKSERPIPKGERVRVTAVDGDKVFVTTVKSEDK